MGARWCHCLVGIRPTSHAATEHPGPYSEPPNVASNWRTRGRTPSDSGNFNQGPCCCLKPKQLLLINPFFSAIVFIVSINWILAVLDRANDLKQLPRTGWLLAGVSVPESIAAHSYATALLALLLADAINADWSGQGLARPLDSERVLRIALLHDLSESLLTDLPKRSADLLGRQTKLKAEARAAQQIFAPAPDGAAYADLWAEYASGASPEAQVVRDADKLEMVHQALRYEASGQRNLAEFWAQPQLHFAASASLYQRLVASRIPSTDKGPANADA